MTVVQRLAAFTTDPAGGNPAGVVISSRHPASEPDPDAAGPQARRVRQVVYDAAGRVAGAKVIAPVTTPAEDWICTTYDSRGRPTSRSVPAFGGQAARTVTYNWAVDGPLKTSVADAAGTITTTVDLLGRITAYTDAKANTTSRTYDQAGRLTATPVPTCWPPPPAPTTRPGGPPRNPGTGGGGHRPLRCGHGGAAAQRRGGLRQRQPPGPA